MAECTIYDKLRYIQETKALIKEAIESQDVEVLESDAFRKYAEYITQIRKVSSVNGKVGDVIITAEELGAITEIPSEYVTETELNDKGYLTTIPDEYVTDEELNSALSSKQDKGNYITVETADNKYALKSEIPDVSNFITNSVDNLINYYKKTETYSQSEIDAKIAAITTINFEVVAELPESGEANKIYLVPNSTQGEQNVKDEYIWIEEKWELIGSTQIDLSNYYNKGEVDSKLSAKVDLSTYTSDKDTFALKSELTNLATKEELDGKVDDAEIVDMLTKTEASNIYQPKGDYLTSIPEEYITETELNAKGYATETWVGEQGFLTEHQDISNLATKTEVTEGLATKQDTLVSGTNIKTINGESILGSGNIVIQGGGSSDVDKAYVDEQLALKADKTSVPTVQTGMSGNEKNYVYSYGGVGSNKNVVSRISSNFLQDAVEIKYKIWGSDNQFIVTLNSSTSEKAGVMTSSDKIKLDSINVSNIATKDELNLKANTSDLSNYLTTSDAESNYAKKSEIPSLEGYLQTSVAESTYATKTEVTDGLATKQDKGDYALKSEIPSVEGYLKSVELTQSEYDSLPTKEDGVLYIITDSQRDYYTKAEIDEMLGIINNKITEINNLI